MQLGPKNGKEVYHNRRQKLFEKIKGGVAIIPAAHEHIRNNDVHHPYRQDSTHYYLTGFPEQEAIAVLTNCSDKPSYTLFVRTRNPERELWDGFRYGVEGAEKYFGADKVYPIEEFDKVIADLMKGAEKLYYRFNDNREWDLRILDLLEKFRLSLGRTGRGMLDVLDIRSVVGEMRLKKDETEKNLLRKAAEISALGHVLAMKATRPGMMEYQVQAICENEFRRLGAERLGYGSIVATGKNATVLHYVFNNCELKKGDLLLIDAGAEYGFYSGDITRTFPVDGKFTSAQKKIYEAVLRVQKACLTQVKPGNKLTEIHKFAIEGLVDGMLELGLLKGDKKQIIEEKKYTKYYPHGTGHWLGMDVHDAGLYQLGTEPRKLEPGMCFTVEPGLYVPIDDQDAPAEFRGIGIRIEDDVLVTESGVEVMTSKVPKEVSEIEALMAH